MLLELAAANAAFAVIKETISNGGDILDAGQHLFTYFDNKASIQRKASTSNSNSDMEEFMALEQLKKQEIKLKELMIYMGRPGLWNDWLAFQVKAKKKREAEAKAAELKQLEFIENVKWVGIWTMLVTVVSALLFLLATIIIGLKGEI
jgi:hypothetical protein